MILLQFASGLIGVLIAGLYVLFLVSFLSPATYRALDRWARDVWDSLQSMWERRRWLAEWNLKMDIGPA